MKYVSQIIMLYILNIYRAVYKLYLNKAGKKNKSLYIWFSTSHVVNLLQ